MATAKAKKKPFRDPFLATDGGLNIILPDEEQPEANDNIVIDPETGGVEINHEDGSITIDPTGASLWQKPDDGDESHDENLALKIDPVELGRIAEDLLTAIDQDKQDRSQWEQMRAKCIELLGLKLEDPKGDVSRSGGSMSTSVVRDPILLEAVERFRANAYAELCPSQGPVKVVNFADSQAGTEDLAECLQKDMNYYLTTTASEYYPDTRYMLWWTGLASGTFKKVYACPLRRRPVSEYVDGTDLIVPSNATDLKNATRITHEVNMPRDIMRAMQLEGVYVDVELSEPMQAQMNAVELKKANVEGKSSQPQRIEDQEYTVYECYCKLDIKGYEHKIKGKPTGLPLPYRVTIEDTSRKVLEVRRNWDEADNDEVFRQPKIPFVLFPYSTGISRIYGSGLGQMLGNMASALTALLRISIDNGMMSNYPGLLKAKGTGRQLTNEIMVPPGGCAEIDTGGLPIQQTIMGMPFKDVSAPTMTLIAALRDVGQRLGGTADMLVGEGKQDAPVGTTLAMIEQSTKLESSVHKGLHAAQGEELRLFVGLFRADPEALLRGNKRPAFGNATDDGSKSARLEKIKMALDNCDIQPMADPNVSSDMHRKLMALGFKQLTAGNPLYDQMKVDKRIAKLAFKMSESDFDSMLAPPGSGVPPPDPIAMGALQLKEKELMLEAAKGQATVDKANKDRESKENTEVVKLVAGLMGGGEVKEEVIEPVEVKSPEVDPLAVANLHLQARKLNQSEQKMWLDAQNAKADRESRNNQKAMDVASRLAIHPENQEVVNSQLGAMSPFMSPVEKPKPKPAPSMADGGAVKQEPTPMYVRWLEEYRPSGRSS